MRDSQPTYSSYNEMRGRIALRPALTLQERKRGRLAPAEQAIVGRGKAAEQRLTAYGKLNGRYGARL